MIYERSGSTRIKRPRVGQAASLRDERFVFRSERFNYSRDKRYLSGRKCNLLARVSLRNEKRPA